MVKIVKFMLCVPYRNKKIGKKNYRIVQHKE